MALIWNTHHCCSFSCSFTYYMRVRHTKLYKQTWVCFSLSPLECYRCFLFLFLSRLLTVTCLCSCLTPQLMPLVSWDCIISLANRQGKWGRRLLCIVIFGKKRGYVLFFAFCAFPCAQVVRRFCKILIYCHSSLHFSMLFWEQVFFFLVWLGCFFFSKLFLLFCLCKW